MRTTIHIPGAMLQEAMKHSKAVTKRDAVVTALEEYNRRHRMGRLIGLLGRSDGFYTNGELRRLRNMD